MTVESVLALLAQELSGIRAKEHVTEISKFHRIQASPGYDEAAAYVSGVLERAGVECRTHEYPADGRSKTYEWVAPPAWTIHDGSLWQVAPERRCLGRFTEMPLVVCPHSPGGTVEAELVHVGDGSRDADYEHADVSGRFVLATGRVLQVIRQAAPRGAVGVVIYPDGDRAAPSHDLVQYQGIFPHADEIETLIPGFSVSRRVADGLVRAMTDGPVRLEGHVDAEFIDGRVRVIEAVIHGEDPDAGEVLLTAHLCHPQQSANDNASGSAVLLEIATVLRRFSEETGLRNSVRFLWIPEFHGSLPWSAKHHERLRSVHHVINLDMVGQSPEIIGEPLRIFRSPSETPSYVNACVAPLAARIVDDPNSLSARGSTRVLHWILDRPSGGSDHLVFGAPPHALPALMLGHNDPYWHTDQDTLEKVDPTRLKQVGILSALLALLPTLAGDEKDRIVDWTFDYGLQSLLRAREILRGAPDGNGRRILDAALRVEEARLGTLDDLGVDAAVLNARIDALRIIQGQLIAGFESTGDGDDGSKPRRLIDGALAYAVTDAWNDEERTFFRDALSANHRMMAESLLRLCDGRHTVPEIAAILSLDTERCVEIEHVRRGIELLAKAGYVKAQ